MRFQQMLRVGTIKVMLYNEQHLQMWYSTDNVIRLDTAQDLHVKKNILSLLL